MNRKIIIIPDSFKGSMTSRQVADILESEGQRLLNADYISIPIADGGEGSVECILSSLGGHKEYVQVKSPEMLDINAYYGITSANDAIVEIAESSGITKQTSFNTGMATTYGFGQLIKAALDKGCRKIYLCLGGSATTDCGCGMAAALGIRFISANGREFIPVGNTLSLIETIDFSQRDCRIDKTEFIIMSDVENPLFGENGAAYLYAPQKGASPNEVKRLDMGLQHINTIIHALTGRDYSMLKGAGAAGGTGYACSIFLNAEIRSGIETMLELSDFDTKKTTCSLIITGEGKLDQQSLMGKVLSGIRKHADNTPITVFCGSSEISADEAERLGITILEIGRGITLTESMANGTKYLSIKAAEYFKNLSHSS